MAGLLATVRDEVAALDLSRRTLLRFGVVVGGVFLALAALSAVRHDGTLTRVAQGFAVVGGVLLLGGLVAPRALGSVYRAWMTAAFVMGFVMTRLVLTAAFVLVFAPVGLVFRLLRRDVLDQRPDPAAPSYWIRRTDGPSGRERLERMY